MARIALGPSTPRNSIVELKNKRVLVVGLGKSGVASALFLKARGAQVTVSDSKAETSCGRRFRYCWIRVSRSRLEAMGNAPSASRI